MAEDIWSYDDGTWADWNVHWAAANWTNTTPVPAPVAPRTATINARNYTFTTPVPSFMIPRAAQINERWRVEPAALRSLFVTRNADPGAYVFSGYSVSTGRAAGPWTVYDAFIKLGPWPDVHPSMYVDILFEDRVISIKAEDRSIQIPAEDRTVTIRK